MKHLIAVIAAALLAGSAWAQSSPATSTSTGSTPPAASEMPPSDPVSSTTPATPTANAPGVYYGDTSGKVASKTDPAAAPTCEERNKAQVHGDVSTTVVAGNHASGTYNSAAFNVSQHYGDCDTPNSGVTVSVSARVGKGNFHNSRW